MIVSILLAVWRFVVGLEAGVGSSEAVVDEDDERRLENRPRLVSSIG